MKLIFFLLEKNKTGGTERVLATLREELEREGHEVRLLYLRSALPLEPWERVIRPAPWRFTEGREILKKKNPFLLFSRLADALRLSRDRGRAKRALSRTDPDGFFLCHPLLLPALPRTLQSRSFLYLHRDPEELFASHAARGLLLRYKKRLPLLLLTEEAASLLRARGFRAEHLPNPLAHLPAERIPAEENRAVVILSRFSPEKRLPETVVLLKKAMEKHPFPVFLYGEGEEKEAVLTAMGDHPAFTLAPAPADPKEIWQKARLTLSLSRHEGYPMALLEAQSYGIPTLTLPFGAGAGALSDGGKAGLAAQNEEDLLSHLLRLLEDDDALRTLSEGAFLHAKAHEKSSVAKDLVTLLTNEEK